MEYSGCDFFCGVTHMTPVAVLVVLVVVVLVLVRFVSREGFQFTPPAHTLRRTVAPHVSNRRRLSESDIYYRFKAYAKSKGRDVMKYLARQVAALRGDTNVHETIKTFDAAASTLAGRKTPVAKSAMRSTLVSLHSLVYSTSRGLPTESKFLQFYNRCAAAGGGPCPALYKSMIGDPILYKVTFANGPGGKPATVNVNLKPIVDDFWRDYSPVLIARVVTKREYAAFAILIALAHHTQSPKLLSFLKTNPMAWQFGATATEYVLVRVPPGNY